MMFVSDVLSQTLLASSSPNVPQFLWKSTMQKVTNLCHFLPSYRDGKWLCRCMQHNLFPANRYPFFVKFPSLTESISVCACAANAVKALSTGWGILPAVGRHKCPDPCACGWEGLICVQLVQREVGPDSCNITHMHTVIGLWVPNVSMPPMSMNFAYWPTWTTRSHM
jgi:hypothetical protein